LLGFGFWFLKVANWDAKWQSLLLLDFGHHKKIDLSYAVHGQKYAVNGQKFEQ